LEKSYDFVLKKESHRNISSILRNFKRIPIYPALKKKLKISKKIESPENTTKYLLPSRKKLPTPKVTSKKIIHRNFIYLLIFSNYCEIN
jgi:hypothetical protein